MAIHYESTPERKGLSWTSGSSWRSSLLSGGSWSIVRPFLSVHGMVPHGPWPYALIDRVADRLVALPEGVHRERRVSRNGIVSDMFRAQDVGDRSKDAVLFLHGGAFLVGGPGTHKRAAGHISLMTGADVFVPRYSEVNKRTIPDIINEAVEAYQELLSKYDSVSILGDSAGGFLSFALLNAIGEQGLPKPSSVVTFSPLASLDPKEKIGAFYGSKDPMFPTNALWGLYRIARRNGTLREDLTVHTDHIAGMGVPVFVVASAHEFLTSDAQWLAGQAGEKVQLKLVPHMLHDFPVLCELCPEGMKVLAEAGDFLLANMLDGRVDSPQMRMVQS